MRIQATVELARMLRLLLQLSLTPSGTNGRAQPLCFGVRMLPNEGSERAVVVKQSVAPCLGSMHQRHSSARLSGDPCDSSPNRIGVGVTHEFAQVLHVSAPRFVALDAVRKFDRFAQFVRQFNPCKLVVAQLDKLLAELLQRVHLPFQLGLTQSFGVVRRRFHIVSYHTDVTPFALSDQRLRELALDAIAHARSLGASDASCEVSESTGLSVSVRKKKVETIERTRDKGLGITVYIGKRRGNASTSDFARPALQQAVEAAHNIARFTADDDAAGLPDVDTLQRSPRDLDLFHPWSIDTGEAIKLAQRCEAAAFAVSPQIVNSEGANVYTSSGHFVLANTQQFIGGYAYSRHSISVAPIARDQNGMQRDDWYTSSRIADELASPESVGDYAARRALARLSARQLKTRQCPVLFEAPLSCGLLGNFVQAASGGALYRNASFLVDSLGKSVFSDHITLHEDPYLPQGPGSSPFDEEGVRGIKRDVVAGGVLTGYFLSSYSARKLGMRSTGNSGGSYNFEIRSSATRRNDDLPGMVRRLGTGLLVTDLIGQGVNYVSGDYSRGASGFWVEGGEIRYPVEEITVAGNLRDMFRNIVAVGNDQVVRGSKISGSLLIDGLTVGGA